MAEPIVVQRRPYLVDLPAGDYLWCACGRSRTQPFCDGSHAGTGMAPLKFTVKPRGPMEKVWLCGCKHSKDKPFCDGTHNKLQPCHSELSEESCCLRRDPSQRSG